MIYKYLDKNIVSLLQSVGTLKREQLLLFFTDQYQRTNVEFSLKTLTKQRQIKYDPGTDTYTFPAAPEVSDEVLRRRIYAFWVFAYWGCSNILQVALMEYPSQFLAFTHGNDAVDVTVVTSIHEARLAAQVRAKNGLRTVDDDVNHIAVVFDPSVGDALKDLGFDSYCILDRATFHPIYTSLVG